MFINAEEYKSNLRCLIKNDSQKYRNNNDCVLFTSSFTVLYFEGFFKTNYCFIQFYLSKAIVSWK